MNHYPSGGSHRIPSTNDADYPAVINCTPLSGIPVDTGIETPVFYGFGYINVRNRAIAAGILVLIAIMSFFVLAPIFSSPEFYAGTIATLDDKRGNVTALMAASTAASGAISLLPGDAGTPIADKLADLSVDFLIVLSALYLEKFLLTTLGAATFRVLVPLGIILIAVALFVRSRMDVPGALIRLAMKLIVFGLAIVLVIPASVWVTDNIDRSFDLNLSASVAETQSAVDELSDEAAAAKNAEEAEAQNDTGGNFLTDLLSSAQEGLSTLTGGVEEALDALNNALNTLVDTMAVMIVTSCVIPLVVLLFFLWLVNALTGLNINLPLRFTRYIPAAPHH